MRKMRDIHWCDTTLAQGPHFCLVTTQKQFDALLKEMEVAPSAFVNEGAFATTNIFSDKTGRARCVVGMHPPGYYSDHIDGIHLATFLAHEATHIWQVYCDEIGEDKPGAEQEAYAIQNILEELMRSYYRQTMSR